MLDTISNAVTNAITAAYGPAPEDDAAFDEWCADTYSRAERILGGLGEGVVSAPVEVRDSWENLRQAMKELRASTAALERREAAFLPRRGFRLIQGGHDRREETVNG